MPLTKAEEIEKAYQKGLQDGLSKRRMYVDFDEEASLPVDWAEYTDAYEREVIASIVGMPEYQEQFRKNMVRQAMLKWRQARMNQGNPRMVEMLFCVGNAIMELVELYDRAKDDERPTNDTEDHGYNSLLTEL